MNINCDIIGDLLPLYAEDLVSQSSRTMIDEHLTSCQSCRDRLAHMGELVPLHQSEKQAEAVPLKRLRFRLLVTILGFPLWFPLLLSAAAIVLSLYICLWAVVVCLWCVPVSLGAVALAAWVVGVVGVLQGSLGAALFYGGAGIICAGLTVLLFLLVKALTVGVGKGTARVFRRIRRKRNV